MVWWCSLHYQILAIWSYCVYHGWWHEKFGWRFRNSSMDWTFGFQFTNGWCTFCTKVCDCVGTSEKRRSWFANWWSTNTTPCCCNCVAICWNFSSSSNRRIDGWFGQCSHCHGFFGSVVCYWKTRQYCLNTATCGIGAGRWGLLFDQFQWWRTLESSNSWANRNGWCCLGNTRCCTCRSRWYSR